MSTRLAWGHVTALAIWIAISGAAYLYFDARQKPTIITARADLAGGQVVIPRSRDGHYYIRGAIRGQTVDFMVDTGASIVSVSRAVARKANLPAGIPANFSTAGGMVAGPFHRGGAESGPTSGSGTSTAPAAGASASDGASKPLQALLDYEVTAHLLTPPSPRC